MPAKVNVNSQSEDQAMKENSVLGYCPVCKKVIRDDGKSCGRCLSELKQWMQNNPVDMEIVRKYEWKGEGDYIKVALPDGRKVKVRINPPED